MNIIDVAFVLTAGILASLSPCSFPLLPGYMSYYIGANPSLTKAIPSILWCSLGLIFILSAVGAGLSVIGSILHPIIPFLSPLAGIFMVTMALFMIFNVNIEVPLKPVLINRRRGTIGVFVYGMIYGLAASSCSASVFLSIILYALALGPLYGAVAFTIYSIGMSLPIAVATLLASMAKAFVLKRLTRSTNKLRRMGAGILLIMGLYLIMGSLQQL